MKFILKDNLIHIVGNHGLHNNNIEVEVLTPELEGFKLSYSINGSQYIDFENTISLSEKDLKRSSIRLVIKAVKGRNIINYKSDDIPLTHAIVFGKKLEDSYPDVINYLMQRMDRLEKLLGIKEKDIDTRVEQSEVFLKNTMRQIVETFEEINKKGSLF